MLRSLWLQNHSKVKWLYILEVNAVVEDDPRIFNNFIQGCHVVCRDDNRVCSSVFSNQGIRQILMRGLESKGRLTQGTGFQDAQSNTYIAKTANKQ